jgi:hypothetical protein
MPHRKPKPLLPRPKGTEGKYPCGFCGRNAKSCQFCPVAIKNAAGKPGSTWLCSCALADPEHHAKYNLVPR